MPVLPFTRQRNPFEVELLNDQTEGRECHLPSNISLRPSSQFLGTDSRYLKDAGLIIESESKALTPHLQHPFAPFGQLTTFRPRTLEGTVW